MTPNPAPPPAALVEFIAEIFDPKVAQSLRAEQRTIWARSLLQDMATDEGTALRSWLLAIEAGRGLPSHCVANESGGEQWVVAWLGRSRFTEANADDLLRIAAHLHQRGETT